MKGEDLIRLNRLKAARQPVAVVTKIAGGEQVVLDADEAANHPLSEEISARFRSGKSGMVEAETGEHFIAVHVPPPRIVVIGAVHISQALYPMAQACGFDVMIVDPRTAFATPDRFAGVPLHAEWPSEIENELALDAYTALVALTHDPKIDDFPLTKALERGCFYVGALGSRKTHAKRRDRLGEAGVEDTALDRIAAPIGLDIGAASPAEIAVAILAQVIEALRKPGT